MYAIRKREQFEMATETQGAVRIATAVLAATIAAGAAFWLNHLANNPDSDAVAFALTATICAGAVTYLVGSVRSGHVSLGLRWTGWVLMVAPLLLFPSTFSLYLPIVAVLAATLWRRKPPEKTRRQQPRTPFPKETP